MALFERFEEKIDEYSGNLPRRRSNWQRLAYDKYLQKLEALLAVADKNNSFWIAGTGESAGAG